MNDHPQEHIGILSGDKACTDSNSQHKGSQTRRDRLAMELATFSRGKNPLTGACQADGAGQACQVTLEHQFGEEASSAAMRLRVVNGRADMATLSCVLTP